MKFVKQHKKPLALTFIVTYLVLQIVAPRLQLALTPNFDTSCYSGSLRYIERVSTNSSCGASPKTALGFPFVFNYRYNTTVQNSLILAVDMLPVLVVGFLVFRPASNKV